MFKFMNGKSSRFLQSKRTPPSGSCDDQNEQPKQASAAPSLPASLNASLNEVKQRMGESTDVIIREIRVGQAKELHMALIFTDGLTDTKSVQMFVMGSLMGDEHVEAIERMIASPAQLISHLKEWVLPVGEIEDICDMDSLFTALLSGQVILLVDGYTQGLSIDLREWKDRGVGEPTGQSVIRGPQEGFSESLRTNTALIRRKIKDPNLWLKSKVIGTRTKTEIAVMYIKGVASEQVITEVNQRLDRIDIDGILESSYIEELIEDKTFTPFPTVFNSERPDVIAAGLLEGRVAILVDGTPFVLMVPGLFIHFYQSAEDYYQRADISTLLRLLRLLGLFIALLAPSLYVAITTFHQEMLPTPLLMSLAAQREGVPFPAFIEALMMEVAFEILREAGIRMPKAVGQAISIVGTLVIGQAAVDAGIVSAGMVIIVAITAISSFIVPGFSLSISIRILRFGLMGLAASFGLFGITVGIIALLLHMCSLRSFGVPYMSPFAPFIVSEQKDTVFRLPRWGILSRPHMNSGVSLIRGRGKSRKGK